MDDGTVSDLSYHHCVQCGRAHSISRKLSDWEYVRKGKNPSIICPDCMSALKRRREKESAPKRMVGL